MSTSTAPQAPIKADRMSPGRWMRLLAWRHLIAILFVIWALCIYNRDAAASL